jgi:HAD superfamily hydrolase (TIGR01490 family)
MVMTEEKRPYAVFDIDGTLIRWQLWHAVVNQLYKQGIVSESAQTAIKEARMRWKRREDEDLFHAYELETIKAYDKALSKLTKEALTQAIETVLDEYKDQTYVYTRNLIKELKAKKYLLFAVSGSHLEIVEALAKYYGFDGWGGTEFEYKDGKYTGNATVMRRDEKPKYLAKLVAEHQASQTGSIAVGDTDSDIPMLEAAEYKIAFNPNKKLFQHAQEQGWSIVIERKNMIYTLESKDGQYVLETPNS